jgi:hypothetical protein
VNITVMISRWQRAPGVSRCLDGLSQQTRIPDKVLLALRRGDRGAWDVVRGADFAMPGFEVHRPGHIAPCSRA